MEKLRSFEHCSPVFVRYGKSHPVPGATMNAVCLLSRSALYCATWSGSTAGGSSHES